MLGYLLPNLWVTFASLVGMPIIDAAHIMLGAVALGTLAMLLRRRPLNQWIHWEKSDLVLFVLVMIGIGWPFIGTHPMTIWGVANEDLFDGLRGAYALEMNSGIIGGYRQAHMGGSSFSQYTASWLYDWLSLRPIGLLSQYWHLMFCYAMLAVILKDFLVMLGYDRRRFAYPAALMMAFGFGFLFTFYLGHVGTTMMMPLVLWVVIRLLERRWDTRHLLMYLAILGFLFMGYVFLLVLFVPPMILYGTYCYLNRPNLPTLFSYRIIRPISKYFASERGMLCFIVTTALAGMLLLYPFLGVFRERTMNTLRAMGQTLSIDYLAEYFGMKSVVFPYFTGWQLTRWPELPILAQAILVVLLVGLSVVGFCSSLERKHLPFLRMFALWLLMCGIGCRFVITDPYYLYKIYYLSYFMVIVMILRGYVTVIRNFTSRILLSVTCFAMAFICMNFYAMSFALYETTQRPYNNAPDATYEFVRQCQQQGIPGFRVNTRYDDEHILEFVGKRDGFVSLHSQTYHDHNLQLLIDNNVKAMSDEAVRARYESLTGGSRLNAPIMTAVRGYPSILSFDQTRDMIIAKNDLYEAHDCANTPWFEVSSYFEVERSSGILDGKSFRWINHDMIFFIYNWPADATRISFYARAGFGSPDGCDLEVILNDKPVAQRTLTASGNRYTIELPDAPQPDEAGEAITLRLRGTSKPTDKIVPYTERYLKTLVADMHVFNPQDLALDSQLSQPPVFHYGTNNTATLLLGNGWSSLHPAKKPFYWMQAQQAEILLENRQPAAKPVYLHLTFSPNEGLPPETEIRATIASNMADSRFYSVSSCLYDTNKLLLPLPAYVDHNPETVILSITPAPPPAEDGISYVLRLIQAEIR